MSLKVVVATVLVFIACCFNVLSLEKLVKYSPGCGELVTFSQFLFIACYGFVRVAKCGKQKPVVPIRQYVLAVVMFYGSSISGNMALGCNISMPIQMIFKSGSVLASLVLGVVLLKRSYPTSKYIAVAMITIGISMCLLISADVKENTDEEQEDMTIWFFGILLLLASLFLGARLGIAQEQIFLQYGKHPEEMLFYTNVLALPAFIFFTKKILHQASIFNQSELYEVAVVGIRVPYIWLYLIANVLSQFICINSVYILAAEMPALSVNVLLTLRKFISLVASIFYFQNAFTLYHWLGTVLVFGGTMLFSGIVHNIFAIGKVKTKKTE